MLNIDILTVAPTDFTGFLSSHIVQRAEKEKTARINIVDIRNFANGCYRKIDDSPYGGGAGMILRYEPIVNALNSLRTENTYTIMMTPSGYPYNQNIARRLAENLNHIVLICGHYEGIDERVMHHVDLKLSIGDYVLTGGELPSMIVADTILRQLNGNIKSASLEEESFNENLLEYPQYTRPKEIDGYEVPEVLLSGNHQEIKTWRYEQSIIMTTKFRPDLLKKNNIQSGYYKTKIRSNKMASKEQNNKFDISSLSNELIYRRFMLINNNELSHFFSEMTIPEYIALNLILKNEKNDPIYGGKTYLSDLAESLHRPMRYVSKLSRTLQDKGLVIWKHDGDGEQGTYVMITDDGKALIEKHQKTTQAFYGHVVEKFGQQNMIKLLDLMKQLDTVITSELEGEK
ncbi:tRNA (guanosine(37)-N1)-methyltransferase TrmD [Pseudoramibacter sp.]|jgi:tRNA (guanine37-N1)-methyltransferase|uniref:tRNA (guanosine(37)-N1)-methyltransferase TrmD n=1 Tax=Pseudoramibacter sp. TaxID=2034862 RepID=UPI0025FDD38D|nr:tRNA (guanosine(37)-N1)-methyltransferase TrmD [Pseudoramibacter sp.]MCH4072811.1 tRNA (guanosine(37)-N1)-methyltransferase TrmD [Pseudoramibacter sp.]MCH4106582.1 tRNA (guanosine(37)-N1)-methyltransferase TrmD [Pseudoramibacter sp.]